MKRILSMLLCFCMFAPLAPAMAEAESLPPSIQLEEFETPAANASQTSAGLLMRIAYMERMLGSLALSAYHEGSGWSAQDEIRDMWAPVYCYINAYELGADNGWEHTDQGFVRVPAEHVNKIFNDMYGVAFEKLPAVSHAYASMMVHDELLDVYDISGTDGDTLLPVLRNVTLDDNCSAKVVYDITREIIGQDATGYTRMGTVTIYLDCGAESTYGLKPIKLDFTREPLRKP